MNKIFIDLEFCPVARRNKTARKLSIAEVIQLGAVKLNDKDEIVSKYNAYVKPQYSILTAAIKELTHISENDLVNASDYATVMNDFLQWVGEDETSIYSWSNEDKRQLLRECRLKEYSDVRLERLFDNWVDFQMVFDHILGVNQQISLTNALNGAGITFEGQEHSADDDAENTARLYILTRDEKQFKTQASAILELMMPTPELTFDLSSFFTADVMQRLALG